MKRITPEKIEDLAKEEVFVFGSNEAGMHGAGAAFLAQKKFGADMGVGFGPMGSCFAIPTKDWNVQTLDLESVGHYIKRFIAFAEDYPEVKFMVTQIGCGLAGFTPEEIAPLFKDCVDKENIWLPEVFINIITKKYASQIN